MLVDRLASNIYARSTRSQARDVCASQEGISLLPTHFHITAMPSLISSYRSNVVCLDKV